MRFNVFYNSPSRRVKKTALIMAAVFLTGCSSNTMRFADGIFTNSTSVKQSGNRPLPVQPIPSSPDMVTQTPNRVTQNIEHRDLPPVGNAPTSSLPLDEGQMQTAGLGAPPRNLGTLPADEVEPPVLSRDHSNHGQSGDGSRYIVQSGDTLTRIAHRQGISIAQLRESNALQGDIIRIGQALIIPSSSSQTVAASQAVVTPAVHSGNAAASPVKQSSAVNVPSSTATGTTSGNSTTATSQEAPEVKQAAVTPPQTSGISGLRWPAKGRILSSFGQREGTVTNDGLDIMVPEGTSVKAAENGLVIYANDGLKEFGNTILIRHENGLVTVYGHNSKLLVQRGQKVRRGDEIAKSGMSGNATTPKLHFEVRKNSTPVNPVKYLES